MGAARRRPPPLALTMGDPAGIGLEIALRAWGERFERALHPFVFYADPEAVSERARRLGLSAPIEIVAALADAADHFHERIPVRPIRLRAAVRPGEPDPANAAAVILSIEEATAAVVRGEASAIVTCPIAKSTLYAAGFKHPGHTEFLGTLAERHHPGRRYHPVMMLASSELKVVPATVHIPISEVPRSISRSLIFDTVRVMWDALRHDFGIEEPRIAVAGLNPHAGESGTIGTEDEDIVKPAVRELRHEGLAVSGPYPADTMFHAAARKGYDAALCMYHDQALIPLKTLSFDTGVNVTLGLPFIRTSPDHGTAFDIAAQGRASPESLIQAIRLASEMASARSIAASRESQ